MSKLRKLTYWCCTQTEDSACFNIRASTKKEANRLRTERGSLVYSKPFKVTVEYQNAFDLLKMCMGEGSISECAEGK